jgi:hypothetical protein
MSLLFAQTSPALAPGASVGMIHNISLYKKFLETMRFFEEFCGPANYSHWLFHTSAERQARIFTLSTYKFSENQISENSLSERMTICSKRCYAFKSYLSGNQQQRANSLAALTSFILPNCVLFGADFTMLELVLADTEVSVNKRMDATFSHPSFTVEFRLILS